MIKALLCIKTFPYMLFYPTLMNIGRFTAIIAGLKFLNNELKNGRS